ncbi:MAG: UvrD-helicase domain-containing protein, partial [Bacillota bacterium]
DDSGLRELVSTLHRFTRSHPWPEQWLAAQAEAYGPGRASACLSSTPWARVLLKSAAAELQGLAALLDKAAAAASRGQGLQPYCSVLEEDMEKVNELLELCRAALAQAEGCHPGNHGSQEAYSRSGNAGSEASRYETGAAVIDPEPDPSGGQIAVNLEQSSQSNADLRAVNPRGTAPDDGCWDALHKAFSSFELDRLPRCGKDADKTVQEEIKAARNLVKDKIRRLYENGFNVTAAEAIEDFRKLYPQLKYLAALVSEFDSIYMEKKKSRGLLDFNDLEHFCLKVLVEDGRATEAAKALRERYDEILVDEYQDSNMVQEIILNVVSGNEDGRHNIFMVGDVKQSIYRFRQAMPEIFMSKYLSYPAERGHDNRVIQLYTNFRSRPSIINGVNFIFKQIMSPLVGELDYTEKEYLNPGAVFGEPEAGCKTGGNIEVHILDVTSDDAEFIPGSAADADEAEDTDGPVRGDMNGVNGNGARDDEEEEPPDNIQAEARLIGKRIRELVCREPGAGTDGKGIHVYDGSLKRYRPAEYKDIVILMRATKNWADIFVEELAAMGIPAYADTGMGYFSSVEVETMLSLLQIIDNPLQDIPMLAVLRSPIGGFGTDELADIRLADRTVSIYEAMKILADSPHIKAGSGVREKVAKFLDRLAKWRDAAQYMPIDELVWMLVNETGYYSYVGILPGGPERQANLRILFERAGQYEKTSYKGLFNFISFINKLKSGGGDMGSARILGENDNVVRIMSIHKSKGLEFPIVIVAGCGKRFNMMDLNADILLHQELGFGPDLVDLDRRTITPVISKFAIRQKLRLEVLSEEMRILYVAFTRTKEKLIITGSVRDAAKTCARWCAIAEMAGEKLPSFEVMQASSYFDWIGPALARHESLASIRNAAQLAGSAGWVLSDPSGWETRFYGKGITTVKQEEPGTEQDFFSWLEGAVTTAGAASAAEAASTFETAVTPAVSKASSATAAVPGVIAGSDDTATATAAPTATNTAAEAGAAPAVASQSQDELRPACERDEVDAAETRRIISCLEWEYPYSALSAIPAKISVTELKRRFSDDDRDGAAIPYIKPLIAKPLFMKTEKELSAAHKGTIMHFVMQRLDLERLRLAYKEDGPESSFHGFLQEIRDQLAAMTANELLTEAEAGTVRTEAIAAFFKTHLGRRMLAAHEVYRETAFSIEARYTDIFRDLPEDVSDGETMLLQGIIDCWFETDNGLVLLDYKTDYVPEGGSGIIRERYRTQIDYYTKALEQLTGKKVTERYLYLFSSGELLPC